MILHTKISEDGTIAAKIPKSLRGKKVKISIEREGTNASSNWEEISAIFKNADNLNLPKRNHKKILDDLRTFRES